MKNRIARTRQFVRDHSHTVVAVAGVAAGAAVTYKLTKSNLPNFVLNASTEQLNQLLANPGSYLEFETPKQMILFTVDNA